MLLQCQGRGCPQKERRGRKKAQTHSLNPGPSRLHTTHPPDDVNHSENEVTYLLDGVELVNPSNEVDIEVPMKWNLHVGMKPSQFDDGASNGELELEDDLPYGSAIEVN